MYQTYAFLMDRVTICFGRATPVTKKTRTVMSVFFSLVGVARLELAALRSRTVRATKLRYTPFIVVYDCF